MGGNVGIIRYSKDSDGLWTPKETTLRFAVQSSGFCPNGNILSYHMPIVLALSLPGVRATAVETLDRMGPVTGEKESRLVSELASLRSGAADLIRLSALPALYGRDHRFLNYLNELLRTGNRWERALAASELFGLGEVDTALRAGRDSEPRVRRSLAWAIGRYRDQRGAEILGQLIEDPDDGVANEASKILDASRRAGIQLRPNVQPFSCGGHCSRN